MKDPQDPGDDGTEAAPGNSPSSVPSPGTTPDTGQVGNVIRPPRFGSNSPRRLDVEPNSLLSVVAGVSALSTGVQLAEYRAIASLFLAESIERLNYAPNGDIVVYDFADFTQTAARFLAAEESAELGHDGGLTEDGDIADDANIADDLQIGPQLPVANFPKFRLDQTFDGWVHDLSQSEDIAELSAVLGSKSGQTYTKITNAVTLIHGLPRFLKRCLNGEFTIEHVEVAARATKNLGFRYVTHMDEYLGQRRADITIETFTKSLNTKVAALQSADERLEEAAKRRRVSFTNYPDGTAAVTLSGPAPELKAFYLRIEAFARAFRSGNISAFTDEFASGAEVIEERSIDALMFDICTRVAPQLTIDVTTHDTTSGSTSTKKIALDMPNEGTPTSAEIASIVHRAANSAQADAEADAQSAAGNGNGTAAKVTTSINLIMPTHGQWVREQAKMIVTVPFLTLLGKSDLPGVFSDDSPVPAEAVRAIAGECTTWTRILTDKATGTPLDARAKSYRIPAELRLPLLAKWRSCTAPGCIRRGETAEIDHIIPFDHEAPDLGGQTSFNDLHPLCKPHHQAKTDRKFSIRMTSDGTIEYTFAHGVTASSAPPDNAINADHAWLFEQLGRPPDGTADGPSSGPPAGPSDRPPGRSAGGPSNGPPGTHGPRSTLPNCPKKTPPKSTPRGKRRTESSRDLWEANRSTADPWDSDDPPPF